jgi:large subunit ribosomal protein L13
MSPRTRTYTPRAGEIQRNWRVIDAGGRPLGRVASEVAQVLKGKDKPTYTPHMDTGDFVIVVNASKVAVTGRKRRDKIYYTHSMYPGGLKSTNFDKMMAQHPTRAVGWAIWGMLPKNRLGRALYRKLKVYAEGTHPHGAQINEFAAPEKPGRPGKPRPPKKVRSAVAAAPQLEEETLPSPELEAASEVVDPEPTAPVEEQVAAVETEVAETGEAVAEEPPAQPAEEAPAEEPVAEEAAAEQAPPEDTDAVIKSVESDQAAQSAEAPAEETQGLPPLARPVPKTRSRRARAAQTRTGEGDKAEAPPSGGESTEPSGEEKQES